MSSSRLKRNTTYTATATVSAQFIALVSLPLITRLYDSAQFGEFATFTAVIALLASLTTVKLDWAIPNTTSEEEASELVSAGLQTSIFLSIVILLALGILSKILPFSASGSVPAYILLLPVTLCLFSGQLLLNAVHVRKGELKFFSISKICQALATLGFTVIFGAFFKQDLGLIYAYALGVSVSVFIVAKYPKNTVKLSYKKLLKVFSFLCSMRRVLVPSVFLAVVNTLLQSSMLFLLILFYDSQVVGWYGLVFRMAVAPIGLITTSLVHSFWSEAASLVKSDPLELDRLYKAVTLKLALFSIPLLLALLSSPYYLPVIIGNSAEWAGASELLICLIPYLGGMLIFSPTTHLIVYEKSHWQLAIDSITLLGVIVVFSVTSIFCREAWISILGGSTVFLIGYIGRYKAHLRANVEFRETQTVGLS